MIFTLVSIIAMSICYYLDCQLKTYVFVELGVIALWVLFNCNASSSGSNYCFFDCDGGSDGFDGGSDGFDGGGD